MKIFLGRSSFGTTKKSVLVLICLFFVLCGYADKPNKNDLIRKCKKNILNKRIQLFIISPPTSNAKLNLDALYIMLYLDFKICEKKDYTISRD